MKRAVRVILLLAILTGLLYWADLGEVFAAIGGIPPLILLGALLIATADRFMMALKWSQLVRAAGGPMGLMQAVRIYYQAGFTSMVLPTQLGPDLLRVYLGKRLGISSGLLVASMTVEKVIAVLAGAFLAAAGLVYLGARLPADTRVEMWLGVDIGVALTGLALLLFLFAPFHRFVGGFLRNRVTPQVYSFLKQLSSSALDYRGRPGALAVNLALTLAENLVVLLLMLVLGRAVGVTLPLLPFLATLAAVSFIRRTAAYVESWGLAEALTVVMYALLGLDRNHAVALAFMTYAVAMAAATPGAFLLMRSGIGWRGASISEGGRRESVSA